MKDRPNGYILEARIPWAMLVGPNGLTNKPPVPVQLVGFNVFANDGDDPNAPSQEVAMGFTGRPGDWGNPGAWATVQMDPPQAVSPPHLKVTRQTDGSVRLSWPTQATGFLLQQTPALGGTWAAVSAQVKVEADQNYILVQPPASTAFFRLAR
ncbi:MAG: hypothetical protein HY735_07560 [Verrucomicrobia bacterium]|nr:hypothetical protein [Verrucomicrobiota bacterium]